MESLLTNLGINWRLLIAQGVNFLLLVILLTYFLYKPLVKLLNERRVRIEGGLRDADLAEKKLGEIEVLKKEEILKGERAALVIIENANKDGQINRANIIKRAEEDAAEVKAKTEDLGRRLIQRELNNLENNAKDLIEKAIFASVELHPEDIDEKLVTDAVGIIKKMRS